MGTVPDGLGGRQKPAGAPENRNAATWIAAFQVSGRPLSVRRERERAASLTSSFELRSFLHLRGENGLYQVAPADQPCRMLPEVVPERRAADEERG
jgi:hypothetical protein